MENASKALLIAGAILIVILLIAVGMIVYNSSRGSIDEAVAQMSSQEIQMFNQQFKQYEGTNVSGSNVRALIERVNSNNVVNGTGSGKNVKINGVAVEGTSPNYTFKGSTATYYSVKITNDTNNGLVKSIAVSTPGAGGAGGATP